MSQNATHDSNQSNDKNAKINLLPAISLPKGGGAIRGIDEKLSVNPVTGTFSMSVPISVSPGRSEFTPQLTLSYDSGTGNGAFGLGWSLSLPAITRKTEKELPKYQDDDESDTFILSGYEDLVPTLTDAGLREVIDDGTYLIYPYRPRIEGLFARIEKWYEKKTKNVFWRSVSKENITTYYGKTAQARISSSGGDKVFQWLIEEMYDGCGNVIKYLYKKEDTEGIEHSLAEKHRLTSGEGFTQRYIKRIYYGNKNPCFTDAPINANEYLFEVLFDYAEHGYTAAKINADDRENKYNVHYSIEPVNDWECRLDPFSNYRAGFEIRTYRLCQRILMFHRIDSLDVEPLLVHATQFKYKQNKVVTYLESIKETGFKKIDDAYELKSIPELEFAYTELKTDEQIHSIAPEYLKDLPGGMDEQKNRWVDLEREGITGILSDYGDAWYYKSNLGNGRFGSAHLVATKPSSSLLQQGYQQLMDLVGDGKNYLVSFQRPLAGYYEQEDGEWKAFSAFQSIPNIDWEDPNLKFIDLNGDGCADLLLSQDDIFIWYPSKGKEGFGASEIIHKSIDEEKGPITICQDAEESIYLADLNGDGLVDLVRIKNNQVCYWPNLGYGHFGAKIMMLNSPTFDYPDQFEQKRILLADIDGSGTSDLIYTTANCVKIWFNQAGNSWSDEYQIQNFPIVKNSNYVSVVDLLGNGTSCLVWSSKLPDEENSMKYLDLMGRSKPHLLQIIKNNMGAETRLYYTSSTQYYLADKSIGNNWITKLPFPVHVVERIEKLDYISKNKTISSYRYHHGFFEQEEREFRGFGMVEQEDQEIFEGKFQLPPVRTKSWFHTGYYKKENNISKYCSDEYYLGDLKAFQLSDTNLPPNLTVKERQEACRALKGRILRQEMYLVDATPLSVHPYFTIEYRYQVNQLQPLKNSIRNAIFYAYEHESIEYCYERNPNDPRIKHKIVVEVDKYGNITDQVDITYPRRPNVNGDVDYPAEQKKLQIIYNHTRYINCSNKREFYRVSVPYEFRSFEVSGLVWEWLSAKGFFTKEDLINCTVSPDVFQAYEWERESSEKGIHKRIIKWERSYFKEDAGADNFTDEVRLPLGNIESLALPFDKYQTVFTDQTVDNFSWSETDKKNRLIGYHQEMDYPQYFWIRSGKQKYESARFYQPYMFEDPDGNIHELTYDEYRLLIISTKDPVGNEIKAENDYRVLKPAKITDPNGNRSQVQFDSLGIVVAKALMGKEDECEGDSLDDPTAWFEYTLDNWKLNGQANYAHTLAREKHQDSHTRWQETYTYFDGYDREVQSRVLAEPTEDGYKRWIVTGWKVFNTKGKPIKAFEPFFADTHEFSDVHQGEHLTLFYDPLDRVIAILHPNNTYEKVIYAAWSESRWDVNDTILSSPFFDAHVNEFFNRLNQLESLETWYVQRKDGQLGQKEKEAAEKAAAHAETHAVYHYDTHGRIFLIVEKNGKDHNGNQLEYRTHTTFDIQGNPRIITDARASRVMEFKYDMLNKKIFQKSADAGEHWLFYNVTGEQIWRREGLERQFLTRYDQLHRPLEIRVQEKGLAGEIIEQVTERIIYGDSPEIEFTDEEIRNGNLRNKVYKHFDSAGVITYDRYDFKGNLSKHSRQLLLEYQKQADWSQSVSLEDEIFRGETMYDALNRPVHLTTPHTPMMQANTISLIYNEIGLLDRVVASVRGSEAQTFVEKIDYNEKNQRKFIEYGNGVRTTYEYDEQTFRLKHIFTTRTNEANPLQDLHYTYDPVGNIIEIADLANQTIIFNNSVVSPNRKYKYDPLYRLIEAIGREHIGQTTGFSPYDDPDDNKRAKLSHPHDGNAMRTYIERYQYDEVGNVLNLHHQYGGLLPGSWNRNYSYQPDDGELKQNHLWRTSAGDEPGAPFATYDYDAYGNMIVMPHLEVLEWDAYNRLSHIQRGTTESYYCYDVNGERVRKVVEKNNGKLIEERIYLGGFEIYRQRSSNGKLLLERETLQIMDNQKCIALVDTKTVDANQALSQLSVKNIRYQLTDHIDSAAFEIDEEARVISYEEYYPYGGTSYQGVCQYQEVSLKRYRYVGKEKDEETGLYYFGSRYYASWLGRWISPDPAGLVDGVNLYVYTKNNPIRFIDRGGKQSTQSSTTTPVAATSGGTSSAAANSTSAGSTGVGVMALPKADPKVYNSKWDQYIEKHYSGQLTITILVEQAVPGSRDCIDPFSKRFVGHTSIRVERWVVNSQGNKVKEVTYMGFWPGTAYGKAQVLDNKKVTGAVVDDSDEANIWDVGKTYVITQDQAEKALKFMKQYDKKEYHMITRNCTTFGVETLEHIGIKAPTKKHKWDIPWYLIIWAFIRGIWSFSRFFGYTPADAGEDIRKTGQYISFDNNAKKSSKKK